MSRLGVLVVLQRRRHDPDQAVLLRHLQPAQAVLALVDVAERGAVGDADQPAGQVVAPAVIGADEGALVGAAGLLLDAALRWRQTLRKARSTPSVPRATRIGWPVSLWTTKSPGLRSWPEKADDDRDAGGTAGRPRAGSAPDRSTPSTGVWLTPGPSSRVLVRTMSSIRSRYATWSACCIALSSRSRSCRRRSPARCR